MNIQPMINATITDSINKGLTKNEAIDKAKMLLNGYILSIADMAEAEDHIMRVADMKYTQPEK